MNRRQLIAGLGSLLLADTALGLTARVEIDSAISDWDKAKAKRAESKLITNPESE